MESYKKLEQLWGQTNGYEEGRTVACSSGTTALHLALEALQLPLGSIVAVPEFTMVACARAVTLAGLRPVFIDCHKYNLIMDVERLREVVSNCKHYSTEVRAIMPVHIYGRRCSMELITEIAERNNCYVVEDLSEAHGILPHPSSHAACWSFYKNKIVAGEEGGAICFKEQDHADLATQLRSLGFTSSHDFAHIPRGINGRLSNANAQLILDCLEQGLDQILAKRKAVAECYLDNLRIEVHMPPRNVNWVHDIRLPQFTNMDLVVQELNSQGIAARHGFKPMSTQLEYYPGPDAPYPRSRAMVCSQRVMYLPIRTDMKEVEVRANCRAFTQLLQVETANL